MPGFAKQSEMTWNFHWAGVVMKDGGDNISLENYAIMFKSTGDPKKDAENREKAYNWVNRDWVFQMYGTEKKGQTFHEQHLAMESRHEEMLSLLKGVLVGCLDPV